MPLPEQVHVNRPLSNLLVTRVVTGFAIPSLFPTLVVEKESDVYFRFAPEPLITPPRTQRGVTSTYNEIEYSVTTDTYTIEEYGLEHAVDDRVRENADDPLRPIENAAKILQDLLLLDLELRGYQTLMTSGIPSATPAVRWNQANATIVQDIKTAKAIIRQNCGIDPNTIVIPAAVWDVISERPEIYQRIPANQPKALTKDMFATLVEIPNVIIAGAVQNSAKEGLAASISEIWGSNVVLAFVTNEPAIERPTFGYTFVKRNANWVVEQYREEKRRSTIVRVRREYAIRVVMPQAGYLLTNVLA